MWDQIKSGWHQMAGQVRSNWNKLTDDELTIISAKRDQLIGFLQESYGYEKEHAERELDKFTNGRTSSSATVKSVDPLAVTCAFATSPRQKYATYLRFGYNAAELQIN